MSIEGAGLTDEEIRNLLPAEIRDLMVMGVPYTASPRDIADAATDKALVVAHKWLWEQAPGIVSRFEKAFDIQVEAGNP